MIFILGRQPVAISAERECEDGMFASCWDSSYMGCVIFIFDMWFHWNFMFNAMAMVEGAIFNYRRNQ